MVSSAEWLSVAGAGRAVGPGGDVVEVAVGGAGAAAGAGAVSVGGVGESVQVGAVAVGGGVGGGALSNGSYISSVAGAVS